MDIPEIPHIDGPDLGAIPPLVDAEPGHDDPFDPDPGVGHVDPFDPGDDLEPGHDLGHDPDLGAIPHLGEDDGPDGHVPPGGPELPHEPHEPTNPTGWWEHDEQDRFESIFGDDRESRQASVFEILHDGDDPDDAWQAANEAFPNDRLRLAEVAYVLWGDEAGEHYEHVIPPSWLDGTWRDEMLARIHETHPEADGSNPLIDDCRTPADAWRLMFNWGGDGTGTPHYDTTQSLTDAIGHQLFGDDYTSWIPVIEGAGGVEPGPGVPVDPTPPIELPLEPIHPVEPVEPVQPVEPIEPVEPVEPIHPVEPIEPVEPVHPVEPIEPVHPVEPIIETPSVEHPTVEGTPVDGPHPEAPPVETPHGGGPHLSGPPIDGPHVDGTLIGTPPQGDLPPTGPVPEPGAPTFVEPPGGTAPPPPDGSLVDPPPLLGEPPEAPTAQPDPPDHDPSSIGAIAGAGGAAVAAGALGAALGGRRKRKSDAESTDEAPTGQPSEPTDR
jgi:hypothetical protein